MGMADLYQTQDHIILAPLTETFVRLTRQAERDIRQIMAHRLSKADWAPAALVKMLAHDEIEIAQCLITSSPLLDDEDLIDLLEDASLDHQIQVAQRPGLHSGPAAHIVKQARPAVLIALCGNRSAQLDQDSLSGLVDASRRIAALRAPLARHPRMDQALAQKLYAWVSETLRQTISERFNIDPASLARASHEAAHLASQSGHTPSIEDESAHRLIEKLHGADQLRPAYLVRAAREGRLSLFTLGLATLGDFPVHQVRRALVSTSARPLFLACLAVGVDRAVFPSLLASLKTANNGYPRDHDQSLEQLASRSAAQASQEFRTLMNSLDGSSV